MLASTPPRVLDRFDGVIRTDRQLGADFGGLPIGRGKACQWRVEADFQRVGRGGALGPLVQRVRLVARDEGDGLDALLLHQVLVDHGTGLIGGDHAEHGVAARRRVEVLGEGVGNVHRAGLLDHRDDGRRRGVE